MAEYATSVATLPYDYNTQRHVGWMDKLNCDCTQGQGGNLYNYLYHQKTVNYISKKVTDYLWPLMNRPIVAPDEQIIGMITNVWNIWTGTLYGDFNKAGLRRHPKIKLRERHPQYMAFNMNY